MKSIITLVFILGVSLGVFAQNDPVKVTDGYKVEIKTSAVCEMCKETIERDMAFEKGVKTATLDVETKVLTVIYNQKKTDPEKIRKRVGAIGYYADDQKRDTEAYNNLPFCCKDGSHGGNH